MVEGNGIIYYENFFKNNDKFLKISFYNNCDYHILYNQYINDIDYAIFPNEYHTALYNLKSNKNIYLGNPKYDWVYNKEEIYKRYDLDPSYKYIIIFYPKIKWIRSLNDIEMKRFNIFMREIYNYSEEYKIIIKCRKSSPVYASHIKHYHIKDNYFFPFASLELLNIADLAVMYSSSVNEECVMTHTPYIK